MDSTGLVHIPSFLTKFIKKKGSGNFSLVSKSDHLTRLYHAVGF
jgi:hypothetical protein